MVTTASGRSDPAYLYEVLEMVIDAGATVVNIPDTTGYTVPEQEETTQWANSVSSSMSGKQSVDFLLDQNLVSEATRDQLEWATHLSRLRLHFLNWILSIENQPNPPRLEFACFPPPQQESEEAPLAAIEQSQASIPQGT